MGISTPALVESWWALRDELFAYMDSKKNALIQFADYVANTFFRNMKRIKESGKNIKLLRRNLCGRRIFGYPQDYDIHISTDL